MLITNFETYTQSHSFCLDFYDVTMADDGGNSVLVVDQEKVGIMYEYHECIGLVEMNPNGFFCQIKSERIIQMYCWTKSRKSMRKLCSPKTFLWQTLFALKSFCDGSDNSCLQSCKNVQTVQTSRCYFFWPVLIFGKSTRKTGENTRKQALFWC